MTHPSYRWYMPETIAPTIETRRSPFGRHWPHRDAWEAKTSTVKTRAMRFKGGVPRAAAQVNQL